MALLLASHALSNGGALPPAQPIETGEFDVTNSGNIAILDFNVRNLLGGPSSPRGAKYTQRRTTDRCTNGSPAGKLVNVLGLTAENPKDYGERQDIDSTSGCAPAHTITLYQQKGQTKWEYAITLMHEYIHVERRGNQRALDDGDPNTNPDPVDTPSGAAREPCPQFPWPPTPAEGPAPKKQSDCCSICDEFETQCKTMQRVCEYLAENGCQYDDISTPNPSSCPLVAALKWHRDRLKEREEACSKCLAHYGHDPATQTPPVQIPCQLSCTIPE